jgi:AraC-like DNA-binding protein
MGRRAHVNGHVRRRDVVLTQNIAHELRQVTDALPQSDIVFAKTFGKLRRVVTPAFEGLMNMYSSASSMLDSASHVEPDFATQERISASRPRGGIAPMALRRVRDHIETNLGAHIDIDYLAALTGLSACHFSRAFKQSMGVPPHQYLISRRVVAAALLIESTDKPLSQIALDVGFSDQSHFTRVFSAQVGESPRRFRHQRR